MSEETIFDKLIRKELPTEVVYEDEHVFAFKDVAPVAATHILIIPKHKGKLTSLSKADEKDEEILGKLLVTAAKISRQLKLEGSRIVINDGEQSGQTVFHLHVHLISGGKFDWPPGVSKL
jgi:diadenosine tetraphosphate (Ap4A) HIT family hydrolase